MCAVKKAFQTIEKKQGLGIRPINRPKQWKRDERERLKGQKKRTWYKEGAFDSVLFVPSSTPDGKLKRTYQKEITRSGHRIKVVEKTGTTLKRQLQTSNPFKPQQCGREDCFVCSSGGSGNCQSEGVTYEIDCKGGCNWKDDNKGESGATHTSGGMNT